MGRGPADVTEPLGHHHPQSPTEHCLDSPLLINLDPSLLPPHSECCFGGGGQVGFSPSFPWFLMRSSISICSLSLESPLLHFSVHNPLSSYLAILSDSSSFLPAPHVLFNLFLMVCVCVCVCVTEASNIYVTRSVNIVLLCFKTLELSFSTSKIKFLLSRPLKSSSLGENCVSLTRL